MKRLLAIVGVALMLGGCAAKQAPAPPAPKVVFEVSPKREAAPPAPTSAQILGAQTPRGPRGGMATPRERQVADLPDVRLCALSVRRRS